MPPVKKPTAKPAEQASSDAEVREREAARAEGDAVEHRAISVGNVVRNRRVSPDESVPRAESRGVYRDHDGTERIVGEGSPIPDGWERVRSASLEDRAEAASSNRGVA